MRTHLGLCLCAGLALPVAAQESLTLHGGASMSIGPGTVVTTAGKVVFAANPSRIHLWGVLRLMNGQPDAISVPVPGCGIRISDPTMDAAVEWNMTTTALYEVPFLDANGLSTAVALYPGDVVAGPRMVRLSTYGTAPDNVPLPPGVTGLLGPLGLDLAADMADRFWRIECAEPLYTDVVLLHTPQESPANGSDELRITTWDGGQWAAPVDGQGQSSPEQVVSTYPVQPGTPLTLAVAREAALGNTIQLALKALLQGPLNHQTGLMNDALRSLPSFPLVEPYTDLGLEFGGGRSIDPGVLTTTGPDAIVDWVVVQLRSVSEPWMVMAGRAALLQRDGDVVDVDGVSPVGFTMPVGTYRIALLHRNHLGVLTAAGVGLGPEPATVDLRNGSVPTFGTQAMGVQNGFHALWAGNVVWDDRLKYVGSGNDRDPILVRIGGVVPTNTVTGYWSEDVTLDGLVKYAGSGNDRDVILNNIGGTVPTAVRLEQLP